MYDRKKLDPWIGLEGLANVFWIDGVVVGNRQFYGFSAVSVNEILKPFAKYARDEIEHLVAGGEESCGGCFQTENGFALHDDDVVFGAKDLLQQVACMREEFDEGWII